MPSIGFDSCSARDPLAHPLVGRLLERRQELVQRRVEEPDRHRQARHRLEDPLEVGLLVRQELVERGAALLLARGHDHLAHDREPVLGHEHVLGAAEADPLRAELPRLRRVLGRVGVRAHLQPAELVGPPEDRLEVLVDLRRDEVDRAEDHPAGAAVDRDRVALAELVAVERGLLRRRGRPRAPRSRRRTACPSRGRRLPRARSCRRGR